MTWREWEAATIGLEWLLRNYENAVEISFDIIVARKGVVGKGKLSSTMP